MKKILIIPLFFTILPVLPVRANENYTKTIPGNWHIIEYDNLEEEKSLLRQFMTIRFLKDGKCLLKTEGQISDEYAWKISGNDLTLTGIKSGIVLEYKIKELNENKFVIEEKKTKHITTHERINKFDASKLTGKWLLREIDNKITRNSNVMTLSDDNTMVMTSDTNKTSIKGTWSLKGNYIFMEYTDIKKKFFLKIKYLSDNKIILFNIDDNFSATFEKQ